MDLSLIQILKRYGLAQSFFLFVFYEILGLLKKPCKLLYLTSPEIPLGKIAKGEMGSDLKNTLYKEAKQREVKMYNVGLTPIRTIRTNQERSITF